MKTLNELMMGEDYAKKTKLFNAKVDAIKKNYKGDFDTDRPMTVMLPDATTGRIAITVDKDVPKDLEILILDAFDSVWK